MHDVAEDRAAGIGVEPQRAAIGLCRRQDRRRGPLLLQIEADRGRIREGVIAVLQRRDQSGRAERRQFGGGLPGMTGITTSNL